MRLEFGVKMVCVETGFVKAWLEFKLTAGEPPKRKKIIVLVHNHKASPVLQKFAMTCQLRLLSGIRTKKEKSSPQSII